MNTATYSGYIGKTLTALKPFVYTGLLGLSLAVAGCSSISDAVGAPKSAQDIRASDVDGVVFVDSFPSVNEAQLAGRSQRDVFKIGDTAEIVFFEVESLSESYVIDRNGSILFPLIGEVQVAGLSTVDLQDVLVERYGRTYLQDPSVTVRIEQQQLGKIVVDGAVGKPGVFDVFEIINLTEAIALAEGLGDDADAEDVYIVRDLNGQRRVKTVNLTQIRQLGAVDPQIVPGDVIFVQDSRERVVLREMLRVAPLMSTLSLFALRL